MLIIGLTGGVASGKNFVASRLQKLKIPVFDADFEVHKLLAGNKEIFLAVKKNFPKAIIDDKIDRKLLSAEVFNDSKKLQNLEQIIYPFLRQQENLFIKQNRRLKKKIVVLNIPLLFEKEDQRKHNRRCHKIIVVLASKQIRLHRFKSRFKTDHHLIHQKFNNIIKHQISDSQRKSRADFVIHNGLSKAFCQRQLQNILKNTCNV